MIRIYVAALLSMAAPALADPAVPEALAAPGATVLATLHAIGAQIYDCRAEAGGKLSWTFREPIATLIADGKTVGRHFVGPTWMLDDGGALVGKVVAHAPGATPADVAWLNLEVVSRNGGGRLEGATIVQRINTKGGVATGACDPQGASLAVPYAADYVFLKK